jgi:hypothetical protein
MVLDEESDHGQTGHFVFICTDEDVDESERVDRVAHNNTPKVFHNVKDPHRHRRRRLISIMNDGDGISSAVHAATQTTPQLVLVNS